MGTGTGGARQELLQCLRLGSGKDGSTAVPGFVCAAVEMCAAREGSAEQGTIPKEP